ncbi:MAG: protease complex subunit PrcB family protein [Candidatus Sericytochromatia bacterium]
MLLRLSLALCLLATLNGCGNRQISPSPAPSSSTQPTASPSTGRITSRISPTTTTQDAVMAEVTRLEKEGVLSDVITLEIYPVQITATGPADVLARLQAQAKGSDSDQTPHFESLSQRSSRITTAGQRMVSDQEAFENLWEEHTGSLSNLPSVDFEQQTVVAVMMGQKKTGGYQITITGVRKEGDDLVVSYSEKIPANGSFNSQVLTSPAHLVRIDASAAKGDFNTLRFEKTSAS